MCQRSVKGRNNIVQNRLKKLLLTVLPPLFDFLHVCLSTVELWLSLPRLHVSLLQKDVRHTEEAGSACKL